MEQTDALNDSTSKHSLEITKLKREITKLEQEIRKWGHPATWFSAVTVLLAVGGFIFQTQSHQANMDDKKRETEGLELQIAGLNTNVDDLNSASDQISTRLGYMTGGLRDIKRDLLKWKGQLRDSSKADASPENYDNIARLIDDILDKVPTDTIDLKDAMISDEALARKLSNLTGHQKSFLNKLYLDKNDLTKIPRLKGFFTLEKLDLRENGITDLKNLADVPQLKQLDLTDTAVTLIDDLELVPNLTNLDLTGCDKIEDFGVLAKLPNLKRLDLDATRVTNKVIEIIANLDDLEELHIQRMDTFSNIQPIENLVKLRILKLSGTAVRDLKPIEDLSELRVLYLPGALKTNPAVLDQLKEMKKRNSRLEWRFGS